MIFSDRPTASAVDLKGQKLRVSGRSVAEFVEDLGASSVAIPSVQSPDLIAKRVVDAMSARFATRRQIDAIARLHERIVALAGRQEDQFYRLNKQFHFEVYAVADSPLLLTIIETLWLRAGPLLALGNPRRALEVSGATHAALVAALCARDAEAAKAALSRDLSASTEDMIAAMSALDPGRRRADAR